MYVCMSTLAGDRVLCQLIALVTLAEEGADEVVALVLTGTLHVTFIHIWRKAHLSHLDLMLINAVIHQLYLKVVE